MTREQQLHHDENADTVARIVRRWRKTGYLSDADQRILTCALQNMRMSCNSTYLLDKTTDHGAKADELATLLEELFEDPAAKAVVFSQWVRTHELIVRRLDAKGWDHVLFHGGVPGAKRGELIDRFLEDPSCRVFLATDAGSTGLNLQHAASTVFNMDQPWNPAILEQRIGRVHRMGQARGVQVVNFVAEGTIEESMLSTLAFKKSLFEGVLDDGEREVFLSGTRLDKFMESVDAAAGGLPEAGSGESARPGAPDAASIPPRKPETETHSSPSPAPPGRGDPEAPATPPATPAAGQDAASEAFSALLDAGVKLLQTLAAPPDGRAAPPPGDAAARIETDPENGQSYLKVPVPDPQTVQRLANALLDLLNNPRR